MSGEVVVDAKGAADLLGVDEVSVSQLSCGRHVLHVLHVRIGETWWTQAIDAIVRQNAVMLGEMAFALVREVRKQTRLREARVVEAREELPAPRSRFDAVVMELGGEM